MESVRLLVVDSDNGIRSAIRKRALEEGYLCDEAADGIAAIKLFRRNDYDLILMDTRLTELDARNVCRQIRKVSDLPILMISSGNQEEEILEFFSLGVDDYILKPFSLSELLARIQVFLHRSAGLKRAVPRVVTFGGLTIDTASRSVFIDDQPVSMPPKEYALLQFLSQNPGRAFSRDALLDEIWGCDYYGQDRTVDAHIKTLRVTIQPYSHYIVTVWGFGYKFAVMG